MDYLLDTNVISYLVEARAAVAARVSRINPVHRLYTSVISEGELLFGIEHAPPSRQERLIIDIGDVMADVTVVPVDSHVAKTYAQTKHHLISHGRIIADNDLWIAAVALANGYTLVSHDSTFARIPGLKLEDWLA